MKDKFVMPKIWEINGKLYEVTLTETLMRKFPGDPSLDFVKRNLIFTPLEVNRGNEADSGIELKV